MRQLKLPERRGLLELILQNARDPDRISPILDATPKDLVSAVKAQGLEGIIAKRLDTQYESRDRSGAWVKFRVNKGQELVIGGYRVGKDTFDNLAVGYYDQRDRLIFIAKLKNGFTPGLKKQIVEDSRLTERVVVGEWKQPATAAHECLKYQRVAHHVFPQQIERQ